MTQIMLVGRPLSNEIFNEHTKIYTLINVCENRLLLSYIILQCEAQTFHRRNKMKKHIFDLKGT